MEIEKQEIDLGNLEMIIQNSNNQPIFNFSKTDMKGTIFIYQNNTDLQYKQINFSYWPSDWKASEGAEKEDLYYQPYRILLKDNTVQIKLIHYYTWDHSDDAENCRYYQIYKTLDGTPIVYSNNTEIV